MLVFSTDDFVKHLCEAKKILMDGTFYTSPTDFTQLYTIHTKISGQVFPVLYALLPNKTELTYVRLLRKIKIYATNLGLTFQSATVQIDFEKAAMNTVYSVFGNNGVQVKGCLFHYCQALFRKVQNLGLSEAYGQEDSEIRKTIKRCFALSLVRAEDFDMAWELIAGNAPPDVKMTRFLDYITDTWVDEANALFPMHIWNHFNNLSIRTNNHLESQHSRFNSAVGKAHPYVFELINKLKTEHKNSELEIRSLNAGHKKRRQNSKYKALNDQTKKLMALYETNKKPLEQYMDQVSYLMRANSV